MNDPEPESYAAAMTELEAILVRVERPDADIDTLAAEVERGAELIEWCRERVDRARRRIDEILVADDE